MSFYGFPFKTTKKQKEHRYQNNKTWSYSYPQPSDELKAEIKKLELNEKNSSLILENEKMELKQESVRLNEENNELQKEIVQLKNKNKELTREYNDLEEEIKKLNLTIEEMLQNHFLEKKTKGIQPVEIKKELLDMIVTLINFRNKQTTNITLKNEIDNFLDKELLRKLRSQLENYRLRPYSLEDYYDTYKKS